MPVDLWRMCFCSKSRRALLILLPLDKQQYMFHIFHLLVITVATLAGQKLSYFEQKMVERQQIQSDFEKEYLFAGGAMQSCYFCNIRTVFVYETVILWFWVVPFSVPVTSHCFNMQFPAAFLELLLSDLQLKLMIASIPYSPLGRILVFSFTAVSFHQ